MGGCDSFTLKTNIAGVWVTGVTPLPSHQSLNRFPICVCLRCTPTHRQTNNSCTSTYLCLAGAHAWKAARLSIKQSYAKSPKSILKSSNVWCLTDETSHGKEKSETLQWIKVMNLGKSGCKVGRCSNKPNVCFCFLYAFWLYSYIYCQNKIFQDNYFFHCFH